MSPPLARDAEDLCAATAQPLHGQDVVGHSSRVSPRVLARSPSEYITGVLRSEAVMVTGSTTREQSTDRTVRVISERTERVSGRRGVKQHFPRRAIEDGHVWILPGTHTVGPCQLGFFKHLHHPGYVGLVWLEPTTGGL
jgi:hypothetical protein